MDRALRRPGDAAGVRDRPISLPGGTDMILVTGCNSLLGRRLVKRLIDAGEKVRCLDLEKPRDLPESAEFVRGDLCDDNDPGILCGDVDVLFHLFDIKSPVHHGRRYMRRVNVRGTRRLLDAAAAAGVSKFIFLSSYEVYGKTEKTPTAEHAVKKMKPATAYGRDKLRAERLCMERQKAGPMGGKGLRPAPLVGPGTWYTITLITLLMALGVEEANRVYVAGHGENRFQLLHPDDAADALMLACRSRVTAGKVYNLGSNDVPMQMEQMLEIKEKARLDAEIRHLSTSRARWLSFLLRPFKIDYLNKGHVLYLLSNLILDCRAAKTDLGWEPKKGNVDILLETIRWYRSEKL